MWKPLQFLPSTPRARLLALGLVAVAIVAVYLLMSRPGDAPRYVTSEVTRGDLRVTVMATGALEPINQVEVGTEVSGTVRRVLVDFNDRVRRGQLLAQLDTQKLEAQVVQSNSALESARASIVTAQATVLEAAENLRRLQKLYEASGGRAPSQQTLETANATLRRAQAGETAARALAKEAAARLRVEQVALAKASIRSPINGIVLKRQIEPGQTVAASLQTPTLFVIAENLKQLRLIVAVAEADIGLVRLGQPASFTVDAFRERRFPARITQVRFASKTTENVVTYDTVLHVSNTDLVLRPGMTATASIVAEERKDVLLIPNAALRFVPEAEGKGGGGSRNRGVLGMLFGRPGGGRPATGGPRKSAETQGPYVLRGGEIRPVAIEAGISDGTLTEVLSGELKAGDRVVTSLRRGK